MKSTTTGFGARWWSVLLTCAAIGAFVTAGTWQLNRATAKRALFAAFAQGSTPAVHDGLAKNADAASLRYQPLRLAGHYDPSRQVLLDNMSSHGRPGYQILTPFVTAAGTVLVNRGWVPAAGDRSLLPDVTVPSGPRILVGRIDLLPRPALRLGPNASGASSPWPRRFLFPTVPEIAAQTGYELRNFQVLLHPEEPDGYLRDWQPAVMGPERHLGYAVQWFGLAATVAVIFGVMARRSSRNR